MTRAALVVGSLCVAVALGGCSAGDGEMTDAGRMRPDGEVRMAPNGVARMTPERALAVARRAMNELHDATYESTVAVEVDGVTRRVALVETMTADGCTRVTSAASFGRTWTRVIGQTMWVKANDRAGEALGRTPAQIELFRGRWIKSPAPELLRGCNLGATVPGRRDAELVESAGRTTVDGVAGRRFRLSGGGLSLTLVIATKGPPLVISNRTEAEPGVLAEVPGGLSLDGTAVLTRTDTGAEVEPPPERLVIDLARLQTVPA